MRTYIVEDVVRCVYKLFMQKKKIWSLAFLVILCKVWPCKCVDFEAFEDKRSSYGWHQQEKKISSSENNEGEYLHRVVQIQSRVQVENGDGWRQSESFSTHNILKALVIIIGLPNYWEFSYANQKEFFALNGDHTYSI